MKHVMNFFKVFIFRVNKFRGQNDVELLGTNLRGEIVQITNDIFHPLIDIVLNYRGFNVSFEGFFTLKVLVLC